MIGEGITDLLLAGYVPLRSHGLALPCYASGPHSNAWYCAVCSIDGDHSGDILAFEPFEADDIIRFPAGAARAVSIGDSWHDVLLWKSDVYVGTPAIIVAQLGDRVAEIASNAPLILLDLAMASDDVDRAALVQAAYVHVQAQWGTGEADRWQSDIFVRQCLMVEARRLLAAAGEHNAADVIRGLEVGRTGGSLTVELPEALRELFLAHQIFQAYAERVAALSAEIGTILTPIFAEDDATAHVEASPLTVTVDPIERNQRLRIDQTLARVLVIASSGRARLLLRHIRAPDWRPDWGETLHSDGRGTPGVMSPPAEQLLRTRLDVVADGTHLPKLDQYAVIIYVADDESFAGDRGRVTLAQIQAAFAHRDAPLCILAPTLPPQMPASALANRSVATEPPLFNTILDTSTVRSPFWVGNSKRSIDRRFADLVSATAQLVGEGSPLHAWLTEDRPRYEPLLLSIASGIRRDRNEAVLSSEVSSAGLVSGRLKDRESELFSWAEVPLGGERTQVLHGEATVRRHDPDFRGFVEAVVRRELPGKLLAPDNRIVGEVPVSIADALQYPHLSAAFRAENERSDAICVVAAEAPNLKALRAAAKAGWSIVRYSDGEGLQSIATSKGKRPPPLPSDISLPKLNRLGRNRGLAIRGVDPRDVIRIPADVYEELRERFADSELLQAVRWYRSSINRFHDLPASAGVAAIPTALFMKAEERHDELARFLREHDHVETRSVGLLAKRTSDLRASWAASVDGAWRLMFEDGKLPIRFGPVDREEVAAQTFFTIDGDATVALLFSSRLFQVWARATLSRSPSWSSRFSITRTFETFPLPDDFLVISNADGGRASLRANPTSRVLETLLDGFDKDLLISNNDFLESRKQRAGSDVRRDYLKTTEEVLLKMIGLSAEATDLDLLERLVEMNRNAGNYPAADVEAPDQWWPNSLSPHVSRPTLSNGMDTQTRLTGTVKWFDSKKGYGFLKPDDQDRDIFVHISALQEAGLDRLKDNQRISFELINDRNGKKSAGRLQLIDSEGSEDEEVSQDTGLRT
jgi:cold shock CspA family protein